MPAKSQAADWDDLRVLLAVKRAGSFAGAARVLGVDQATVGRRVSALERALGTALLDRLPTGFTFTPAGELALRAADESDLAIARLADGLASVERRMSGTVRLTCPETLASGLIAPKLASFRSAHPDLHLEIASSARAANLSQREADVALRLFRPTEPSLSARKLGTYAIGLYAHREYLRRKGRPSEETLGEHELLGYDETLARTPHGQWFSERAGRAGFVLSSNSSYALLAAARAGAGIALLPCLLGDADPSLERVVGPERVRAPELWLVVHSERRRIPRVRVAMEFVARVVAERRAALEGRG